MAGHVTNLVNSIGELCLTDEAPESTRSRFEHGDSSPTPPGEAIQNFIQSAEITITQAQQMSTLVNITDFPVASSAAGLSALRTRAKQLVHASQTLTDFIERYIVAHIISLGKPIGMVQKMLVHFDTEIRRIVQGVLDRSSDDGNILWKVAEECYNQSLKIPVTLHPDSYFAPLDEASLESPYDPDFESEEYYEHENRLEIDDSYAKGFY